MRWIDLLTGERTCPCCNTPLRDLLSVAYSAPEEWDSDSTSQDNDALHTATDDILTHYFFGIQDRHFVRTVMLLPFHDIERFLILGIWVHLDKPSFNLFLRNLSQRRTRGDGHAIWMDCKRHPRLSRSACLFHSTARWVSASHHTRRIRGRCLLWFMTGWHEFQNADHNA